jgi:hypothetical protein
MYRFSAYAPYDPLATYYEEYTSTTTIPTYTLQYNLLSLADQQSRLYAQRQQLAAQERDIQRQRAAVLRRIRAQRFREAIEEAEIEDIVEAVFAKDREGDRQMTIAVMYCAPRKQADDRGVLEDAKARRLEQGLPAERELYREMRLREMLDPSPRGPKVAPHPRYRQTPHPRQPETQNDNATLEEETPFVTELPRVSTLRPFPPEQQYVPETPPAINKRGSRRTSIRRDSQSTPVTERGTISGTTSLQSYITLRAKLQAEISSIPLSIRSDVLPTIEEKKVLNSHMSKLEDLLDEVDAVPFPSEPEEMAATRKARREIVAEIVAAIDGIEKHIQPHTPRESPIREQNTEEEGKTSDSEDSEENALIDFEIQRVIRETLARKKEEENSRQSVTIEDVPDSEY